MTSQRGSQSRSSPQPSDLADARQTRAVRSRYVVVTVTYGKRWSLLRQVIASAKRENFDAVVVVDNGAEGSIASLAMEEFGAFVNVVTLGHNTGSAGGFKAGMQFVLRSQADYVLLIDDDNVIGRGCLDALISAHARRRGSVSQDKLALQAYRPARQANLAKRVSSRGMHSDNPDAYFGFHFLDIPKKLIRRSAWGKKHLETRQIAEEIEINNGPYSGMFFHRSVMELVGLPEERFVLYCDDLEFSARITRAGGQIVLVTAATLTDLEESWDIAPRFTNAFDARLSGEGDFRAFYSTRNNAYYEKFFLGTPGYKRTVNRFLFFTFLRLRALQTQRIDRLRLISRAIALGEKGELGESNDFPLC